jgi:hypothetical protein
MEKCFSLRVVFAPTALDALLWSMIFVLPTLNNPQRFCYIKTRIERCGILCFAKVGTMHSENSASVLLNSSRTALIPKN